MADRYDTSALVVLPFPTPGPQLRHLYLHYNLLANATEAEQKKLRERGINARPWDPATLGTSAQRLELWRWLEDVVAWFNHEYAWDTNQVIPDCWPEHPTSSTRSQSWQTPVAALARPRTQARSRSGTESASRGSWEGCATASSPTARNATRHGRPEPATHAT